MRRDPATPPHSFGLGETVVFCVPGLGGMRIPWNASSSSFWRLGMAVHAWKY